MSDELEQVKEKPKPKRVKKVHARLIKSKGKSALVEWHDGSLKRGYIPVTEFDFDKSQASESALKAAAPYGIDWSKVEIEIDTDLLDSELKNNGFWTVEDLRVNPQVLNIIIMRVAGLGREALRKLGKEAK